MLVYLLFEMWMDVEFVVNVVFVMMLCDVFFVCCVCLWWLIVMVVVCGCCVCCVYPDKYRKTGWIVG